MLAKAAVSDCKMNKHTKKWGKKKNRIYPQECKTEKNGSAFRMSFRTSFLCQPFSVY